MHRRETPRRRRARKTRLDEDLHFRYCVQMMCRCIALNAPRGFRGVHPALLGVWFTLLLLLVPPPVVAQTPLVWYGNLNNQWDQNVTANWLAGAAPSVFTNGAAVLFSDAAVGSGSVTVIGTVQPAGITVSNLSKPYLWTGPGVVDGSGTFTKFGVAPLTLANTTRLTTTGNFAVGAGTVTVFGAPGQTNVVNGQLWVGHTPDSPAHLVLSNTALSVSSWFAIGRGNGTVGHSSSATLYDSILSCNNTALGYWANVPGNRQNPVLTLNGNSRLVNDGSTGFNLGESSGSSATVTINDASYVTSNQRVLLGMASGATGSLLIAASGALTNGGYASVGAVGVGSATLKDNAVWHAPGDFNVADTSGSFGTLAVQDNARLVINTLYVGKAANSTGAVHQTSGRVARGAGGGEWRIGGNVSGGANQLGTYSLANGVLDAGSANVQIGAYGTGQFNQSGGSVFIGGWPSIARFTGSTGMLNVSGGAFYQTGASTALIVGEQGTGTLNLSQIGLIQLANNLVIGHTATASGTVNLNGGTLITRRVLRTDAGATATLNFNGGILRAASGADPAFLEGLTAANVQGRGAIIDSGTNSITVSQDLLNGGGNGGLIKQGAGTLTLSGSLQYAGPTLVSNGRLIITAPNIPATSGITLSENSAFGVRVLASDARVQVLQLGLAGGSQTALDFDLGALGTPTVAPLFVSGTFSLNGVATINLAGANFQLGRLPLLKYGNLAGTGRFVLGTLPYGMAAQLVTNQATQTLELNVTAEPTAPAWSMKQAPLMTDWAQQVDPNNPWPEYPRPQLQRPDWMHLNGVWQWQPGNTADPLPTNNLIGSILVPFCMESAISGVMEHHERAWYRRTFTVPPAWAGQRVLLHFEAVDWECEPFLNGVSLGIHQGGYDPFSFDITPYLTNLGPQALVVRVYDPTDSTSGPVLAPSGKQHLNPGGIWYTPCSGIWQSVWLEPVPVTRIADLQMVPDIDSRQVRIKVAVSGPTAGVSVQATAFDGTNQVSSATGLPGAEFLLPVPTPKLWSPSNPFLYDLRLALVTPSNTLDTVTSYFGMRKISLGNHAGFVKMFLNNQFLFQYGPLDQGYWPDGIYTPPTDLAMRYDLEQSKALGFNLIRKHVKVEPRRWYYYADKLGLLVWQDMPSMVEGRTISDASKANFEAELSRMITTHWNHPSIIVWTVFNEGWGQYDTVRVVSDVMALDPSRLVNCASGWTFYEVGHLEDSHSYPNPSCPQNDTRAVVNGEFGGVGLGITNHTWASGWGYVGATDPADLTARFAAFCDQLSGLIHNNGLSAAVYTQITDVETELNGLYTYDRKVFKPFLRPMQEAIASNYGFYSYTPVVPTSETIAQTWRYTMTAPPSNWATTNFSDAGWNSGPGGFGTAGTPGAVIGTTWNTADIWLRRAFDASGLTPQQMSNLVFRVHHDEAVEIYLNGVLAASAAGYTTAYGTLPMSEAARAAIVSGPNNVLAVHCHQTAGGQYIDVGIDLRTVYAPLMVSPAIVNGQFEVAVTGPAGADYIVYACTNLVQPDWTPILTTNAPAIPFRFTEPIGHAQRYYRVELGP
jgi:autotransporter-associated beta strand protein